MTLIWMASASECTTPSSAAVKTGANMLRDDLTALLAPVVTETGFELWELEYTSRAGGGLLRLYIDSANGITVEDCAKVSHAVSEVLDSADPVPGYYTLEVSSPGLDRVLRTHAHFARFPGEQVQVEMKTVMQMKSAKVVRKRFSGPLLKVDQNEITIEVDGEPVVLPLAGIHKARLAPEL
jgi:ribosome maturation factor RimP